MEFKLFEAISVLERTPRTLRELLLGLSENWTNQNEGGETWSPFDVLGHLIHGERTDWVIRTHIILGDGDKHFELFDRFAQFEESKGKKLEELLSEFAKIRALNLEELSSLNISETDLDRTGIHPEFGDITLRQLLAAWVAHDLGHIAQISRVMAKQYKKEAGPWPKYIAVLTK